MTKIYYNKSTKLFAVNSRALRLEADIKQLQRNLEKEKILYESLDPGIEKVHAKYDARILRNQLKIKRAQLTIENAQEAIKKAEEDRRNELNDYVDKL